jgi:hypothetical protein
LGLPSSFTVDLDLVSPVDVTGIPTGYSVDVKSLPKINIGLDPITVNPIGHFFLICDPGQNSRKA